MAFEVEIKFRVPDPRDLIARLASIGAVAGPEIEHEDLYLAHPSRDFARTDEAVRLRRVGDSNAITYKGPKRGGPTKTREEIEVPFEEGPDGRSRMATVFERLGFRPVATVSKGRTSFSVDRPGRRLLVVIDRARDLGTFAEVETIARDDEDLATAQQAVIALAGSLGLSDVEPRSYLRMTLERASS
jgi:adenylate cyclase class 2